jgi:hypothetical protein
MEGVTSSARINSGIVEFRPPPLLGAVLVGSGSFFFYVGSFLSSPLFAQKKAVKADPARTN